MTAPNIVNVTSITGKTAVVAVLTSPTTLISNAAGSNTVLKVNLLQLSNVNGTSAADVTVDIYRSSTAFRLGYTISLPADAALQVIGGKAPVYLEEGDTLRVTASVAGYVEAVASYEVIA